VLRLHPPHDPARGAVRGPQAPLRQGRPGRAGGRRVAGPRAQDHAMSAAPPRVPRALPAAESTAPPDAARPAGRGASAAPSADRREPTRAFMSLIDHEFARRHLILSAGEDGACELLLVSERTRPTAVHNVGVRLGRPVRTELMAAEAL